MFLKQKHVDSHQYIQDFLVSLKQSLETYKTILKTCFFRCPSYNCTNIEQHEVRTRSAQEGQEIRNMRGKEESKERGEGEKRERRGREERETQTFLLKKEREKNII